MTNLPKDIEAEKAVLGAIIENNQLLWEVDRFLTPQSFFDQFHQIIYQGFLSLNHTGIPIDPITLGDHLNSLKKLDKKKGYPYLANLQESSPVTANIAYYAKIIQEHAIARELSDILSEHLTKCHDPKQNINHLISTIEENISRIKGEYSTTQYRHIKNILVDNFNRLEKNSKSNKSLLGISSGFRELDQIILGLQPTDLIILAARPAMGKTALALNIAKYIASDSTNESKAVLFLSLEMSAEQLGIRLLSADTLIPTNKIKTTNLDLQEWEKLSSATENLSNLPIYINDAMIKLHDIMGIYRQLEKDYKKGIGLIILDYLQLVEDTGQTQYREQEISKVSRNLKKMAKELNIPVLALAQLNRNVENRNDKRPQLSDLRESGAIEQDADIVLFIYRDEVYNKDSPDKGRAEIIIAKHRNGATGQFNLLFKAQCTKFENLAVEENKYNYLNIY